MAYPISDVTRRIVYSGSAGAGPYSFAFEVLEQADIAVYLNTTLLTITTNYTVTIAVDGTGSVTLVSPATGADQVTIVGDRAIARATDFVTGGDLFANSLNDEFDSLVIFTQQVKETADRGLKAAITDPTDVNMTLPAKADRKGKVLAFDSTSGDPVAGPALDSLVTVIAQSAKINTVADNVDDVVIVADNITNVNNVGGSIANVNTVAGSNTNVATVATNIASVNTVATNIADIITAASDLNEAVSEIDTVANSIASVQTVGDNIAIVNTVAGIAANVTNVGNIAANVTTVAGITANVTTVAGVSANVTTVAGVAGNVTTVAGVSASVTTVAGISADVSTVATDSADIQVLAGISGDVSAVENIAANVTTVAGIAGNVTAVAGNATNINTVAGNATNITTVAGINADVTTVASNIAAILDAPNQASDAAASAVSAAQSAASAATILDNFDDRYLGAKASDPALDNDGDPLIVGALYFNTTDGVMKIYTATGWLAASSASVGTLATYEFVATSGQTAFAGLDANGISLSYTAPSILVTLNGVRLRPNDDYTATDGITVTLVAGAVTGDELVIDAFGNFLIADVVSRATGGTFQAAVNVLGNMDATSFTVSGAPLEAGAKNGIFWENEQTITSDYTITAGRNAGTFGAVTIASGVTVTVPTGSRWVIV